MGEIKQRVVQRDPRDNDAVLAIVFMGAGWVVALGVVAGALGLW